MPKGFGWPVLVNRQVRQCPLLTYCVLDCDDANFAQQTSVRVKRVRVVPGSSQAWIRTVESQVRVEECEFTGRGSCRSSPPAWPTTAIGQFADVAVGPSQTALAEERSLPEVTLTVRSWPVAARRNGS